MNQSLQPQFWNLVEFQKEPTLIFKFSGFNLFFTAHCTSVWSLSLKTYPLSLKNRAHFIPKLKEITQNIYVNNMEKKKEKLILLMPKREIREKNKRRREYLHRRVAAGLSSIGSSTKLVGRLFSLSPRVVSYWKKKVKNPPTQWNTHGGKRFLVFSLKTGLSSFLWQKESCFLRHCGAW